MAKTEALGLIKRSEEKTNSEIRNEGKVLGVVYGGALEDAVPVEIEESKLNEVLKKNAKTAVIPMVLDGKKLNVIVKEIQKDGLSPKIAHIDFQAVKKNEVLEMSLPINVIGEEEVLHKKLLLNLALNEVKVKGPADLIPDNVEINVEELKLDDKVLASDLKLPSKIELVTDKDELVLSITESKTASEVEAAEEEAAEAAESAETPEDVKEEPKEEEAKEEK